MLRLELKKLLKTPLILGICFLSVFFSVILSFLPVTYEYCKILQNGQPVEMKGIAALRALQENHSQVSGEITPQLLKEAVNAYHTVMNEYNVALSDDLPEGVYSTELRKYYHIYHMIREAYADPRSGIAPDLAAVTEEQLEQFEEKRAERFTTLLEQENKPIAVRRRAEILYAETPAPLRYIPYFNTNVLDYETLLFMLVMLCSAAIAAPVFSLDYQTGADDIQRCTANGRTKLAAVKCTAVVIIASILYLFSCLVFFTVIRFFYGTEFMNSDIQTYLSLFTYDPWAIGELMRNVAIAGYLCVLCTTLMTLMISSLIHSNGTAAGITGLVICMPVLLDTFIGSRITDWIISFLPSCGLLLQKSFYYAVYTMSFLNFGELAVTTERAMTIIEALEIPVFFGLTLCFYRRQTAR